MKLFFAAAAAAIALAPSPPFPAPKILAVTPEMKCDWGPVTEVKGDRSMVILKTEAGVFELQTGSGVKVASLEGKPLGSVAELKIGQNVRAYYTVDVKRGAFGLELDVIPDAAAAPK